MALSETKLHRASQMLQKLKEVDLENDDPSRLIDVDKQFISKRPLYGTFLIFKGKSLTSITRSIFCCVL